MGEIAHMFAFYSKKINVLLRVKEMFLLNFKSITGRSTLRLQKCMQISTPFFIAFTLKNRF